MVFDSAKKKYVLVVSGSPQVLAELKLGLKETFEIGISATEAGVLAGLDTFEINAILVHIGSPRDAAFSVLAAISGTASGKNVPIIMLADEDNAEDEMEAFASGATDYAVRRRGAFLPLINRINLCALACECTQRIARGELLAPVPDRPEMLLDGKTILIVDDVDLNRDIIEGMLGGIGGLTLDFAADGKQALDKFTLAPDRYSLILMDVQMPVMGGTESAAAIRALRHEKARDIPIIALTAGVEEEETVSYLNAGMNGFLKKPMEYDELLEMVSRYLK